MGTLSNFQKINDNLWEIPKSYRSDMQVPARIYANQNMLTAILQEKAVEQLLNMTTLPGIVQYAVAMPDIHQGYGFPIGGVAAFGLELGVISPGGVGYDINCGVRLLTSPLCKNDLTKQLDKLVSQVYRGVPSGVGSGGSIILTPHELDTVLNTGVSWAIKNGLAFPADALYMEEK